MMEINTGRLAVMKHVRSGIAFGAGAWMVYAVVECWFSVVLPWMVKPASGLGRPHAGFTFILFFFYILFGAITGGTSGLAYAVARRLSIMKNVKPYLFITAVSTAVVVITFDISLIWNTINSSTVSPGLSLLPPLMVSFGILLALAASLFSQARHERLRFITNPWTVSILLLGLPWIFHELLLTHSRLANAAAALAYIVVTALFSYLVLKRFAVPSASLGFAIIILAVVTLVGQGLIFYTGSIPPQVPRDTEYRQTGLSGPNIVLITMDTVRADHLSAYGYERDTSPFLKAFAEEATLFHRAVAPGAMTLSTHASIFTGLHSRQHGSHLDPWNGYPVGRSLSNKFDTLAELLERKGYRTLGVMANTTFLSRFYGLDQGFQYYHNREYTPFLGSTHPFYIRQFVRDISIRFAPREAFDRVYSRAEAINREAIDIIDDGQSEGTPFFLFINYMDAHNPYIPPPPFDTKFPGKDGSFTTALYYPLAIGVAKGEREVTREEHAHLISQYDGAIAYIDSQIGSLIARLKELGVYDNTLIIITSDHGEAFGEHNLFNHGCSVYQDQIHVPLIIKYPGSHQEVGVDETVSLVDLMPTILDALGKEVPSGLAGKSLLRSGQGVTRAVVSETYPSGYLIGHHPKFDRIEHALFSGPYKLIRSTAGKKELYFLPEDQDESKNIFGSALSQAEELETELNQWLEATISESESSAKKMPDKKTLERLKSLGYIK